MEEFIKYERKHILLQAYYTYLATASSYHGVKEALDKITDELFEEVPKETELEDLMELGIQIKDTNNFLENNPNWKPMLRIVKR